MLSIATDFADCRQSALPHLRRIAEAGFSHVMWCHEWNSDHLYGDDEIRQIAGWMKQLGLSLTDLHGSAGEENHWLSPVEGRHRRGVELVKNRIAMTHRLGSDVVTMHAQPPEPPGETAVANENWWSRLRHSLDEAISFARPLEVRIALENLAPDNFDAIERILNQYGQDEVGLCYDSGHGNITGGLDRLEKLKRRLIAMHIHDNNGGSDQHRLPFTGTVDWRRLAGLIAFSPYRKPISMELRLGFFQKWRVGAVLGRAFEAGTRLSNMVEENRRAAPAAGP
jgi:sugar phosphate isomerase/epimerase